MGAAVRGTLLHEAQTLTTADQLVHKETGKKWDCISSCEQVEETVNCEVAFPCACGCNYGWCMEKKTFREILHKFWALGRTKECEIYKRGEALKRGVNGEQTHRLTSDESVVHFEFLVSCQEYDVNTNSTVWLRAGLLWQQNAISSPQLWCVLQAQNPVNSYHNKVDRRSLKFDW